MSHMFKWKGSSLVVGEGAEVARDQSQGHNEAHIMVVLVSANGRVPGSA